MTVSTLNIKKRDDHGTQGTLKGASVLVRSFGHGQRILWFISMQKSNGNSLLWFEQNVQNLHATFFTSTSFAREIIRVGDDTQFSFKIWYEDVLKKS